MQLGQFPAVYEEGEKRQGEEHVKEEIMTYSVPRQGRCSLGEEHSRGSHAGQPQTPHLHPSALQGSLRMGFKSIMCAGLAGNGFSEEAAITVWRCCRGPGLASLVDHVSMQ